jgi:hypothetical protein
MSGIRALLRSVVVRGTRWEWPDLEDRGRGARDDRRQPGGWRSRGKRGRFVNCGGVSYFGNDCYVRCAEKRNTRSGINSEE